MAFKWRWDFEQYWIIIKYALYAEKFLESNGWSITYLQGAIDYFVFLQRILYCRFFYFDDF